MTPLTLSFLLTDTHICLGLKKRGFGAGNWNGYGGKLEEDEGLSAAAVREIEEEAQVYVGEQHLEKVALVEFIFEDGKHLQVHIYFARVWTGDPTETEEMMPKWFTFDEIPYDNMWADDRHWLPRTLAGEKLLGKVWFDRTEEQIKDMKWDSVRALP